MILLGVAISIAVVVAVGFYVSKRVEGDSSNFLVGGRMLPFWLVGGALMGAAVDTNATLGNTDLAFEFGFWAGACLPLGLALCLTITGIFFAKPMNRMGLTSFPDYYRLRFGRSVEVGASVLLAIAFCMLVAGNLVAGGFLFNYFLGMPYWLGVVLIAAIAVAYTGTGGLIADAYTAIIQMSLILVGAIGLFVWMTSTHGLNIAEGTGPFALGQLSDPAQGAVINWATLIALGIGDIVAIDFMARVFSAKSPEAARKACFTAAAGYRRHLRTVRIGCAGGTFVPARGTRRPGAVRPAGPIRAGRADGAGAVRPGRCVDVHRERRDPGDLQCVRAQPRRRPPGT